MANINRNAENLDRQDLSEADINDLLAQLLGGLGTDVAPVKFSTLKDGDTFTIVPDQDPRYEVQRVNEATIHHLMTDMDFPVEDVTAPCWNVNAKRDDHSFSEIDLTGPSRDEYRAENEAFDRY